MILGNATTAIPSNLYAYCKNSTVVEVDDFGFFSYSLTYNSQEIKINSNVWLTTIQLPWLISLILGLVFLIIRVVLIVGDMRGIHSITKHLPTSVVTAISFYIPLTAISELISAVCTITSVTMIVTAIIGIVSAVITGGLSVLVKVALGIILKEVGKAVLGYVIPSIYDICNMLFYSAIHQKGCEYRFKLLGGASIAV